MRTVAVFEAKNRFSELLHAVEQGEEITITRHGCPVARLVSAAASERFPDQKTQVSGAMSRLHELGKGVVLGAPLSEALEEGRD